MKVFHISWNDPETVFHEMPWKKNFTVYPSLKKTNLASTPGPDFVEFSISAIFSILHVAKNDT